MEISDEISQIRAKLHEAIGDTAPASWNDVGPLLAAAEVDNLRTASKLQPWRAIVEVAIGTLFALYEFVGETRSGTEHSAAFMFHVGPGLQFAVSIRALIITGQDDAAHVLFRSLLENMDIALVVRDDPALARRFELGEERADVVWRTEVARGRIHKRAAAVAARAGIESSD